MPGKTSIAMLVSWAIGLFMEQHGLLPKGALLGHGPSDEATFFQELREGFGKIRLDYGLFRGLRIGSGAHLDLYHRPQVGSRGSKDAWIAEQESLSIGV